MRRAAGIAGLVGLAVVLSAALAYALAVRGAVIVWVPSGVLLGLLVSLERRAWPAAALGAYAGNAAIDVARVGVSAVGFIAPAANVLEGVLAVAVLRQLAGAGPVLASVRGVAALILGAAVVSNGVTAFLGGAVFNVWYGQPFAAGWFNWWVGDGLGMIVVAPAVLGLVAGLRRLRRGAPQWPTLVEGVLLTVLVLAIGEAVFRRPAGADPVGTSAFIMFPVLLWMAVRVGPAASAAALCLLAGVVLWHSALGRGPLVDPAHTTLEQAAHMYAFLGLASLSVLVPAAAIGERERAAQQVRASEERYRALVDTAQDAIITIGLDGRIRFANPAVARILGHDPAALVGRPVVELIPPGDREALLAAFGRYLSGEDRTPWRGFLMSGLHRDGRVVPVEFAFGEWESDGRRYFTGIVRDITERKQLEEDLRHLQKMEALGQLTGGVAHEFRNELTVILANAEMALQDVHTGLGLRPMLEEIRDAAARGSSLTRELLAFGRRQLLRPVVLDLDEAVARTVATMRPVLGIGVAVELERGEGRKLVHADPTALQHILMNLMLNAADAMLDGGRLRLRTDAVEVEPELQTRLALPSTGRYHTLEVADTGAGMAPAVVERIFEPFFTTKPRGTGLGLPAVYGLVRQSGGAIRVESVQGVGTTFHIYLPAAEPSAPTG